MIISLFSVILFCLSPQSCCFHSALSCVISFLALLWVIFSCISRSRIFSPSCACRALLFVSAFPCMQDLDALKSDASLAASASLLPPGAALNKRRHSILDVCELFFPLSLPHLHFFFFLQTCSLLSPISVPFPSFSLLVESVALCFLSGFCHFDFRICILLRVLTLLLHFL